MTYAPPLAPLPTETAAFTGCSLSASPDAASRARSFTRHALACWGLAELAEDAQVIVSELLANAIRHGCPGQPGGHPRAEADAPGLWLLRQAEGLMCVVTDPSNLAPALKQPGDTSECGRGLHVVHALSDHWGWTPLREHGKAVWAILFRG
ncbi:MAG: ATP-binding protein [Kitasatospora sp.]|jgi:anti-sigma regulatory factor (Ser/Thr protein kinase)|nr:ATP-binding protein [Kitasatospora sp.]